MIITPFALCKLASSDEGERLFRSNNDEKSRIVDLGRGETFGFLGFDFHYLRSLRGVMRPHCTRWIAPPQSSSPSPAAPD